MRSLSDFREICRHDVPLARLTTFGIGGPARYLFAPRSAEELSRLLAALAADEVPYKVLGGGSNILVPDEGVPGAVVRLAGDFAKSAFDGTRVTVGAAAPLGRLVAECARARSGRRRRPCRHPGNGRRRARHERRRALGSHRRRRRVCNGPRRRRTAASPVAETRLRFRYRGSSLRGRPILGAELALREDDAAAVTARTDEYAAVKRSTQDLAAKSAGCVFKNPPEGLSAGALIDRAGLKGARVGGAEVSRVHANFVVNAGGASAADVRSLVGIVSDKVKSASGIELELEIELW